MVEVTRKKGETFESMFRRFTRHIIKSSTLNFAKSKRFFNKDQNKNAKKTSTLVRLQMSEKYEYLKRIGRIDDKDTKKRRSW